MDYENFDKHKFRLCVVEAKKCIIEIDDDSLNARYLLSQLIYDNENVTNIDFSKLNWKNAKLNYSEWVNNYCESEFKFNFIREFLIKKSQTL
tara:strand:- start:527 stop:802 length:276 start_codon:yes stop_codon:yes gene_type:complete